MPEVKLWSLYTHEASNAPWQFQVPPELNPVSFGSGESSDRQANLKRFRHEWLKGGRIIRWLAENKIDVVLVNGYNDAARVRIINWCHNNAVPVMLWGDSNIRGDRGSFLKRLAKRAVISPILRRCSAVLPCGSLGRAYFAKYGVPNSKMFYFPVEPDYDMIRNLPAERVAEVGKRFGIQPDRRRIVFSGRLVPVKRPDMVIDAFAAVAAERPEWDLLMVGDGPMREALEHRVPEALKRRVIWTGFLGAQEDVASMYRLSHALVLPSQYEPWALVINEAAAAGLAIVCTDVVGAAAELVRTGENGWLFPPGDLPQFEEAVRRVTGATVDAFGAASLEVLAAWRREGDPVTGLQQALAAVRAGHSPAAQSAG